MSTRTDMPEVTCWASEFRADLVTLDGADITHRCAAVILQGEQPVAIVLYDHQPRIVNGTVPRREHRGRITVSGLRRRQAEDE